MNKVILSIVLLTACGDNIKTMVWGDAEDVWADAWCTWAERCYNGEFNALYQNHQFCLGAVKLDNCLPKGVTDCDKEYPYERENVLEQCHKEMSAASCTATVAPDSCFTAFNRNQ